MDYYSGKEKYHNFKTVKDNCIRFFAIASYDNFVQRSWTCTLPIIDKVVQKFYLFVEYGLFSGFFMNKFSCRKKMTIDIFLIFCHDILAMILFRILTKSKGVCFFSYRTKTVHFSWQT